MSKIWVGYPNGIDHPQFVAAYNRCGDQHGPYTQLAAIPLLCQSCNDADREMIQRHIERKEGYVPTKNPR